MAQNPTWRVSLTNRNLSVYPADDDDDDDDEPYDWSPSPRKSPRNRIHQRKTPSEASATPATPARRFQYSEPSQIRTQSASQTPVPSTEDVDVVDGFIRPKRPSPRKRIRLTPEEDVILIRLCVENAEAFQTGQKREFWKLVNSGIQKKTGKQFSNAEQRAKTLVKQRQIELEMEGTGTETGVTEKQQIIDKWIEVCTTAAEMDSRKKEAANKLRLEREEADQVRASLLVGGRDKRRSSAIEFTSDESAVTTPGLEEDSAGFRPRKRRRQEETSQEPDPLVHVINKLADKFGQAQSSSTEAVDKVGQRIDQLEETLESKLEAILARLPQ